MTIGEQNIGDMMLGGTTIRESILHVVTRHRNRAFLVDAATGHAITYGEFHSQACALAAEFRGHGINKGDRVAVMLPNCCELAVLYFACIYLGAVIVPINPALSKSDVQFILASCKPALLVASASSADAIRGFHPNILTMLNNQETGTSLSCPDQINLNSLPAGQFTPLENTNAEDLVVVMYTSGTSARPKGLAHKLGRMFRNAIAFAGVQGIDQESRFYLTLSMAYMGGFYNLLVLPFLCGSTVVVDHVFDARSSLRFWDKAKNNNVNTLWLAPTVLSILLRMDRGRAGEQFCRDSVRHVFVGFAPLPPKVKEQFEARYGVQVIENYGLSETLFVSARSRGDAGENGYVGEVLPGVQLRIVNDRGVAAAGTDGEIQILTPDLMAGYLDEHGDLLPMDAAAWFSTGDVGHLSNDGSLTLTGRKKDLIIRGGVNISPAAIEESLMQVAGIADAAVVSLPHELYGEDIVAVLKLEPGFELDAILESVMAHAKRNLAQHQQPARYTTMDEFPRTTNGKVQKARLRELVAEKLQIARAPATENVQSAEVFH
jgi:long-chain acyl-CoA synthetase